MNQCKILGRLAGLTVLLSSSAAAAQMPIDHSPLPREFQPIEHLLGVKAGVMIAGVTLIGLELWWFLFSKPKTQEQKEDQEQIDSRDQPQAKR